MSEQQCKQITSPPDMGQDQYFEGANQFRSLRCCGPVLLTASSSLHDRASCWPSSHLCAHASPAMRRCCFSLASDGHGGTFITDPPVTASDQGDRRNAANCEEEKPRRHASCEAQSERGTWPRASRRLNPRSSVNRMVNGRPATAFPSASVKGNGVQRLSICATAAR
jgi:hypothetical protein